MKAFAVTDFDQPGSVMDLPDPVAEEGQVLVRVKAAAINPFDAGAAKGSTRSWAPDTRLPFVPGTDAAGTVAALGPGVVRFNVGDEVVGNAGSKGVWGAGTFAELVAIPAEALTLKPSQLSFEVAAAAPQTALTALGAMDALQPAAGDTVIVTGATGGVGTFFTQLATLAGAYVIALARPENVDYARELGASEIFDHTAPGFVDAIRAAHPHGVDALADFSGSAELVAALSAVLRDDGRVAASIGAARQAVPTERGLTAHAANTVDRSRLPEVLEPLAAGTIKPPKMTVIGLDETAAALAEAGQKHGVGKTVIRIASND
jgi:NADPH:quinone reductase-like Zn-dependent oxidoreductase